MSSIFLSQALLRADKPFSALAMFDEKIAQVKGVLDNTINAMTERESLKAALLFVRSGDMSIREIFDHQPVTCDFADFCASLGWVKKWNELINVVV